MDDATYFSRRTELRRQRALLELELAARKEADDRELELQNLEKEVEHYRRALKVRNDG